jgi:PmbA protein
MGLFDRKAMALRLFRAVEVIREAGGTNVATQITAHRLIEVDVQGDAAPKAAHKLTTALQASFTVGGRRVTFRRNDTVPERLRPQVERAITLALQMPPGPDDRLGEEEIEAEIMQREAAAAAGARTTEKELDLYDPKVAALDYDGCRDRALSCAQALAAELAPRHQGAVRRVQLTAGVSRHMMTDPYSDWEGFYDERTSFVRWVHAQVREGAGIGAAVGADAVRHLADAASGPALTRGTYEDAVFRADALVLPRGRAMMYLTRGVMGDVFQGLLAAASGPALVAGASCLAGKLGEQIAPSGLNLIDRPWAPRAWGTRAYDAEGRYTAPRQIIRDGRLVAYYLGRRAARELRLAATTPEPTNLALSAEARHLLTALPSVVRVERVQGGMDPATGAYSFAVEGTMLRDGAPLYAVKTTIAGDIFDLLARCVGEPLDPLPGLALRSAGPWLHPAGLLFDDVAFGGAS